MIERFYRSEVARFPRHLRSRAIALPRLLGISERSRGGWEDYVRLPPFRDLAGFASEGLAISATRLDFYRRASWWGGIVGLTLDRLADGQAQGAVPLSLVECLCSRWLTDLGRALGSRSRAERLIHGALEGWRAGIWLERMARPACSPFEYATFVRAKVRWVTVAACAMVGVHAPAVAAFFSRAAELLLVAAQYEDDAVDDQEDARLCGVGIPQVLGFPKECFLAAASGVLVLASAHARRGGFRRLADWMDVHASSRPAAQGLSGFGALALIQAATEHSDEGVSGALV